MVERIISGGQTGADQGGLAAGVTLDIPTGGLAPRGWKTERGPMPELGALGLEEHFSLQYPPRTRANVESSDGTLLIGNPSSRGSRLTMKLARQAGKPIYVIVSTSFPSDLARHFVPFRTWLRAYRVKVLNVAGNRESVAPGIAKATHDFLVEALQ